ncbi:MAG: signal recognition particle-docking protein FtsY, partial [Betaproteobacteria bacterium]|nr:signal recognition particle-docking protein FtsY [Betaproteobacteria bacterium]
MGGFFAALKRTRKRMPPEISGGETAAFAALRDGLIMADAGAQMAEDIVRAAQNKSGGTPAARTAAVIAARLSRLEASMAAGVQNPFVIMVMGVNGCGKTTSIAKLCRYFGGRGQKVLLAAGDTFRAAAKEQLQEWAAKTGAAEIITGKNPSAVAFDGVREGIARGCGVVILDTAGRLPPQKHLMAELGKIRRAAAKALP